MLVSSPACAVIHLAIFIHAPIANRWRRQHRKPAFCWNTTLGCEKAITALRQQAIQTGINPAASSQQPAASPVSIHYCTVTVPGIDCCIDPEGELFRQSSPPSFSRSFSLLSLASSPPIYSVLILPLPPSLLPFLLLSTAA